MENVHKDLVDVVKDILSNGWRVFIAERGHYGFFTNDTGERVISFQLNLGVVIWNGNYKTSNPKRTGGGWRLQPDTYKNMFYAQPPYWAVGGEKWKYTTLEMHLKTFQKSSKYMEIRNAAN